MYTGYQSGKGYPAFENHCCCWLNWQLRTWRNLSAQSGIPPIRDQHSTTCPAPCPLCALCSAGKFHFLIRPAQERHMRESLERQSPNNHNLNLKKQQLSVLHMLHRQDSTHTLPLSVSRALRFPISYHWWVDTNFSVLATALAAW